jgi:hypothetical protein
VRRVLPACLPYYGISFIKQIAFHRPHVFQEYGLDFPLRVVHGEEAFQVLQLILYNWVYPSEMISCGR